MAIDGSFAYAGVLVLGALSSLNIPKRSQLATTLTDDAATLRGQGSTVRVPVARLACLEVGADDTVRAVLRGGGHVVVPASLSPRDAPYLAQELGAALGVPVVTPALPAGRAIAALPAGEPSSAA